MKILRNIKKLLKKSAKVKAIFFTGSLTLFALMGTAVSTMAWYSHLNAPITGVVESGSTGLTIDNVSGYKNQLTTDPAGFLVSAGEKAITVDSGPSNTNEDQDTADTSFDVPTLGAGYYLIPGLATASGTVFKYSNNGTRKFLEYNPSSQAKITEYVVSQANAPAQIRYYGTEQDPVKGTITVSRIITPSSTMGASSSLSDSTITIGSAGTYNVWFDYASDRLSLGFEVVSSLTPDIANDKGEVAKIQIGEDVEQATRSVFRPGPKKTVSYSASDAGYYTKITLNDDTGWLFRTLWIANITYASGYDKESLKDFVKSYYTTDLSSPKWNKQGTDRGYQFVDDLSTGVNLCAGGSSAPYVFVLPGWINCSVYVENDGNSRIMNNDSDLNKLRKWSDNGNAGDIWNGLRKPITINMHDWGADTSVDNTDDSNRFGTKTITKRFLKADGTTAYSQLAETVRQYDSVSLTNPSSLTGYNCRYWFEGSTYSTATDSFAPRIYTSSSGTNVVAKYDTFAANSTVFLKAGVWDADGATEKYGAYFFDNGTSQHSAWLEMTNEEDDYWSVEVPTGNSSNNKWPAVIFGRFSQDASMSFETRWNQTNDLGASNKNLYSISGWGGDDKKSPGDWSDAFKIIYDGNGATSGSVATVYSWNGADKTASSNSFDKTGNNFTGWNTAAAGSGSNYAVGATISKTDVPKGVVTLYAQWQAKTYTVNQSHTNAGTVTISPATAKFGQALSISWGPENADGYNYSFTGVTVYAGTAASGTILATFGSGTSGNFTMTGTYYANICVAVVYSRSPKTYTIALNGNGADTGHEGPTSVTATYNAEMPSIAANLPTRNGFAFDGYYISDDDGETLGDKYYNADGTSAHNWTTAGTGTLFANWVVWTVTIEYSGNGNTGGTAPAASYSDTFNVGDLIDIAPNSYTKTGYNFGGWDVYRGEVYVTKITAATHRFTTEQAGSDGQRLTLKAHWDRKTTTVTLNMQSGSGGTGEVTASYGLEMPSATMPSRTGYTFGGYFTGENGTGTKYYNADGTSANNWNFEDATKTLYAKWTAKTTTITLNMQSGSDGTSEVTATFDKAMPSAAMPIRTGYTFGGYFVGTNGSGTQYYNADGTSTRNWNLEDATKTLYAKWTANSYTVTFDQQDGSGGDDSATGTYDQNMPAITTPTRNYYDFQGYYSEEDGKGTQYYKADGTYNTTWDIDNDETTLYAYWTPKHYSVYYQDPTGETVLATGEYVYLTGLTLPASVSKENYTWGGWYTDSTLSGNAVTSISSSEHENKTFYAKWTRSITVDKNATNAVSGAVTSITVTYGRPVSAASNALPTRTNYTLTGLYTSPTSGTKITNGDGSTTLNNWTSGLGYIYAQWSANATYFLVGDRNLSGDSSPAWSIESGIPVNDTPISGNQAYEQYVYLPLNTQFKIRNADGTSWYRVDSYDSEHYGSYLTMVDDGTGGHNLKVLSAGYFTVGVNNNAIEGSAGETWATVPFVSITAQGKFVRGSTVDSGLVSITLPAEKQKVRYGDTYTPEVFGNGYTYSTVNYTLSGWYSDSGLTESISSISDVRTAQTIYARFYDNNDYSITIYHYNLQTGTTTQVAATTKKYDQTYDLAASPTATWSGTFVFKGWHSGAYNGSSVSGTQTMKGSALSFYATFNPGYRITFNGSHQDASLSFSTYDGEANTTLGTHFPTATRSGYVLQGWYTTSDGGTTVSSTTTITANTTYYAHWITSASLFNENDRYYVLISHDNWDDSSPSYYVSLTEGIYSGNGTYYANTSKAFTHIAETDLYYIDLPAGSYYKMEILRCPTAGWNGSNEYNKTGEMTVSNFGTDNALQIASGSSFAYNAEGNAFRPFYPYVEGDWIYLRPNSHWKTTVQSTADASVQLTPRYAIYLFGGAATKWIQLEGVTGAGETIEYYRARLTGSDAQDDQEEWVGGIFVRLNPNTNTLSWDDDYNQTPDLYRYQENETLCFVMDEGNSWTDNGTWSILTSREASKWYLIGEAGVGNTSSALYGIDWYLDAVPGQGGHPGEAIQGAAGTDGNQAQWTGTENHGLHLYAGDKLKVVYVQDIIPIWYGYQNVKHNACVNIAGFAAKATGSSTDIVIEKECIVYIYVNSSSQIWISVISYPDQATGVGYSGVNDSTDSDGNRGSFDVTVTVDNTGSEPVIQSITPASHTYATYFDLDHYATANAKSGSLATDYGSLYSGAPTLYGIYIRQTVIVTIKTAISSTAVMNAMIITLDKGKTLGTPNEVITYGDDYSLHYGDSVNGIFNAAKPDASDKTFYTSYSNGTYSGPFNHSTAITDSSTILYLKSTAKASKTLYVDVSGAAWGAIYLTSANGAEVYFSSFVEGSHRSYQISQYLYRIVMPATWNFRINNGFDTVEHDFHDDQPGGYDNWSVQIDSDGGSYIYIRSASNATHRMDWCAIPQSSTSGTATIYINGVAHSTTMSYGDWNTNYFVYETGIEVREGSTIEIEVEGVTTPSAINGTYDSLNYDGSHWYLQAGAQATPSSIVTVHVDDSLNWEKCFLYAYNDNGNNNWPGTELTLAVDKTTIDQVVYSTYNFDYADFSSYTHFILNYYGGSNTTQVDVNISSGYTYALTKNGNAINVSSEAPVIQGTPMHATADVRLNLYIYHTNSGYKWQAAAVPLMGNGFYIVPSVDGNTDGYQNAVKMLTLSSIEASYAKFHAVKGESYYIRSYIDAYDDLYTTYDISAIISCATVSDGIITFGNEGTGDYTFVVYKNTVTVTPYNADSTFKLNGLDVCEGSGTIYSQNTSLVLEVVFTLTNVAPVDISLKVTNGLSGHVGVGLYLSDSRISAYYSTLRSNSGFYNSLSNATNKSASPTLSNYNSSFAYVPESDGTIHTYYAYILIDYVDKTMTTADIGNELSFTLVASQRTS